MNFSYEITEFAKILRETSNLVHPSKFESKEFDDLAPYTKNCWCRRSRHVLFILDQKGWLKK